MRELFRKKIAGDGVSPINKIILAVSGGIDSMVMTDLFSALDNELIVAHCNFRLRGHESDEDEEFVKDICVNNDLTFISKKFDTLSYAEENKISVQMAARDLRYNWFDELRLENAFDYVATAHNLDDQVETFFINLCRGTGIRGLTGISSKNGYLIRPLSHFTREEIEIYASQNEIKWREDSSNISEKYIRNRIRHKVLPLMKEINPSFSKTMEGNINNLSRVQSIYINYIDDKKELILRRTGNYYSISIQSLLKEEFSQSVLYEILADLNFSPSSIKDIWESLWASPGKKFYSGTHRLIKDREDLIIEVYKEPDDKKYYIDQDQKEVSHPIKLSLESAEAGTLSIPPYPDVACLDAEKLSFPLIIRKWHPGDYFQPLGMQNSKKLSDFFVDNKFSIPQKENTWLLCSGQDIAWVIGYRIDNRFRITNNSHKVLKICLME